MRGKASSRWTMSFRRGFFLLWRPAVTCASIVCLAGVGLTQAGPPQIGRVVEAPDTRVRIIDPEEKADTGASETVWIASKPAEAESAAAEEATPEKVEPAPQVTRLVISDVSSKPRRALTQRPAPTQSAAKASLERKLANPTPRLANPMSALPKPIPAVAISIAPSRPTMEVFPAKQPQDSPASSVLGRRLTAKPSLPDLAADLSASPSTSGTTERQQTQAKHSAPRLTAFDRVLRQRPLPTWQPFSRTPSVVRATVSSQTKPVADDHGWTGADEVSRRNDSLRPPPVNDEVRLVTLQTEAPAEPAPAAPADRAVVRPIPTQPAAPAAVDGPVQLGPFEVIDHTDELTVVSRRSKLLRAKVDIYRTAVVDPSVCDVTQFTPREISVIGKGLGATHVTFWFEDDSYRPITYLVRVVADPEVEERREEQYSLLEEHLAEHFPNSKVRLHVVADKLIVKGQARDAAEAAQILAIIRGQYVTGLVVSGKAADAAVGQNSSRTLPAPQVINMLRIPGVQQVALRVKIAELNRSAARNFGVETDLNLHQGELVLNALVSLATGTPSILGSFDGGDLEFGIHYLEEHGVLRMVSEPTLVCLSGESATFVSGGEFAVPTTVGVAGASAVTTDFRAFGAILTFRPVVLDKDHIRLEVAPEFSKINMDNSVGDVPGLDTRAVTTTVEMREGQTLAIAGLLDDSMKGDLESNLPFVARLLGKRGMTRNETELIVLVTPELVHPMEPEEVPPLPGFDVTEPTNWEFYGHGRLEGHPTVHYRSTIWPRLQRRFNAGGPAMISGPYGHGD